MSSTTLPPEIISGQTIGHYRIKRQLGSGGMGDVYAAEDTKLHRLVALKRLTLRAEDPESLRRFEREAQAVAALNHPNVVTVYSVEESNGIHFLTMELIEGKTLADLIPPGGMALAQLMKVAIPLADAVSAAHQVGIVHRDLKPSNVMITAEGRVKVLDFGLAKLKARAEDESGNSAVSTEEQITADNRVLGTAPYMSPEQAQGLPLDHRSDIFSLGIVLYEMATGTRPFRGPNSLAVLSAILKDTPPPLAEVSAHLPGDLDRIVSRCLVKDPERRFQSSLDLRNELEELQQQITSGKITAVRAPVRPRFPAWTRFALLIALVAVAVASVALWFARRDRTPAKAAAPVFTQLTFDPGVESFPSLSPDGKWVVYSGEAAGNRDIYLQSVSGQTPLNLTKDSVDDDFNPAFSRDGEQIAFRSSREGGGLFVMGRTGEAVRRLTRRGFNPSWSPDGKQLVFATENVELRPMNWEGKTELWVVSADGGEPRALGTAGVQPNWSPHGQRIAYVVRRPSPRQLDLATIPAAGGAPVFLSNDAATDWNPVWSPDGRYLYFGSDRGGSMNLWRLRIDEASGKALSEHEPITAPASLLAHISISQDGRRIAYASALLTQNIQKLAFDADAGEVRGDPLPVTTGSRLWSSPDASPDGEWVVFYSQGQPEGDLYVARSDGSRLRQVTGDAAVDRVPRWSPDGQWIASFSNRGGPFDIWKVRPDGSDLQQMTFGGNGVYAVWSPDGSRIATNNPDPGKPGSSVGAHIFDANRPWAEQKPEALPPFEGGKFLPNSWSPDGARIAAQIDMTAKGIATWSLRERKYQRWTQFGEWPVWLPDSRRILLVSRGKEFHILDTATGETRKIFTSSRDVFGPPRFSGRGDAIYFSRRSTESDVWLATLSDGGQPAK